MDPKRAAKALRDDRLSSLPNSLLFHILSFLDMKQVVCTGVLSKGWRNLWTFISNLHFHIYNEDDSSRFVDRTLALHAASKIQKFYLCFYYHAMNFSEVDTWIHFAVQRGVQDLQVEFNDTYMDHLYELPSWLFKCETLISLKLDRCEVTVPDFAYFSLLIKLSLTRIRLYGDSIKKLLAACPLLEDLALVECSIDCGINITSSSSSSNLRLKCLTIEKGFFIGLEVQAPNLQILKVSGDLFGQFSFKDISSLSEVYLDLYYPSSGHLIRYPPKLSIHDLHRAKVLKLSRACIQHLFKETVTPPFRNLHSCVFNVKCLTLKTGLKKYELPGIAYLLMSSPHLETLIMNLVGSRSIHKIEERGKWLKTIRHGNRKEKYKLYEIEYWESLRFSFPCLVHHLKSIKITGFQGLERVSSVDGNNMVTSFVIKQDGQTKLVNFLLKNAMVLEKMTIHVSNKFNIVKAEDWNKLIAAQKLLATPRASSCAKVLFSYD